MSVTQLDHLNMSVDDISVSEAWYRRVFAFGVVEKGIRNGKPWSILKSGEAMLCLYQHPERKHLDGDALEEQQLHGFNHFALRIDDEAAWLDTMRREQLVLLYGGPVQWPHSTAWYVLDPSGYEIEVALWKGGEIVFD